MISSAELPLDFAAVTVCRTPLLSSPLLPRLLIEVVLLKESSVAGFGADCVDVLAGLIPLDDTSAYSSSNPCMLGLYFFFNIPL